MELRKGYKQTEIGVIPEDWGFSKIGKQIDLLTGFPFKSNSYSDNGIRLLRGSNIKRGKTDWSDDIVQYWEGITPEIKKYLLREKDIVIAMDGSLVGRSFAQLSKTDLPALLLQRVARIRTKKIDIGYLKEFVCSLYFTEHCDKVKTSSAIPHISPKDIREFTIPIPPSLNEQNAIAQVLTDTDQLLQNLKTLIAKKKAIKQGAMQELFNDEKSLLGYDSQWDIHSLKDLCSYINDGTHHTPNYVDKGIPFYSVESLSKNDFNNVKYISEQEHLKLISRCKPEKGDILLTRIGTLGITKLIDWDVNASIYVSLALLKVKKNKIDSEYLYSYTKSNRFIQDIIKRSLTNATPQKINMSEIGEVPIYFPSNIREQKAIAQILNDMDAELEALEIQLQKTEKLKQGMMQELLTGKTRLIKPVNQLYIKETESIAKAAENEMDYKIKN